MKNGWIILDKTPGLFSRTAGGRVARMLGTKKFGHIGTLDPMASGVLAIAIGDATKMIPFVEEQGGPEKEYLFSLQFGFETDTLDITGREMRRDDFIPEQGAVRAALGAFIGDIMQTPPAYSAVHISGRRAYEVGRPKYRRAVFIFQNWNLPVAQARHGIFASGAGVAHTCAAWPATSPRNAVPWRRLT